MYILLIEFSEESPPSIYFASMSAMIQINKMKFICCISRMDQATVFDDVVPLRIKQNAFDNR
jgi:hypothetical protein